MRPTVLATAPLLAALATMPAAAQVTAHVHIDIPIGHRDPVVVYRPQPGPRDVVVYDYDRDDYGDWDRGRDYRRWQLVTLYFYAGRYFEQPIRGARPVVVYRYRDRYFYPPRDARWEQRHGRDNDWGRRDDRDRDDRYDRDRNDRNDRNDRSQDSRTGRDQSDRGGRQQDPRSNDHRVPDVRGGRSRP